MEPLKNHPLYGKHTIDTGINALWIFYRQNFAVLFILSFILSLIANYVSTLFNLDDVQALTDPQEMLAIMRQHIRPLLIISVISLFFSTIIHFYIIFNPLDKENTVFISAYRAIKYFIPYVIIIILLSFFGSFVLFLGIIVLIVGVIFAALYILTLFLFILPVMMVEGPDIGNTIKRMISLVHRRFWVNIGWTAIFVLIILVFTLILSGLILLPFTGSFIKTFIDPQNAAEFVNLTSNPVYLILTSVVNALTFPLLPVFATVLYLNGRAREEQDNVDENIILNNNNEVKVEDLYAKSPPDTCDEDN